MAPIGVLVIDDSTVVRRLVTDALQADPDIEVLGTAPNGRIGLSKIAQLSPDVVTLDIEMPVMDGLETVREIRKIYRQLPIIMFSTLTERGATATLQALSQGANDYVTKPANQGSVQASILAVQEQLVPRVKALYAARPRHSGVPPARAPGTSSRPVTTPAPSRAGARLAAPFSPTAQSTNRVDLVVIGSSTGGPEALAQLVAALPPDLEVPVAVVQHMPPIFTRMLAERLSRLGGPQVHEAMTGDVLKAGHIYIAPGDHHLELVHEPARMVARLHQGPQENSCRPAVDVLFRSAAPRGTAVLAVVLTGMGHDGQRGAEMIRSRGGRVLAQDEATSVVWGMPGSVVGAGQADEILPLSSIAAAVASAVAVKRKTHLVPEATT